VGIELLVASYGSTLGAALSMNIFFPLAQALNPTLTFHEFNRILSVPYFPVQIAFGFMVGFIGREWFGTRFTKWVWAFPLLIFMWHFLDFEPSVLLSLQSLWRARFEHFLGSACRPPACFDELRYTSPLYASIAYSLGASMRGRLGLSNGPISQWMKHGLEDLQGGRELGDPVQGGPNEGVEPPIATPKSEK
jgi:hypothetical protein